MYKKIAFILFLAVILFRGQVVFADQVGISVDQTIFAFSTDPGITQEVSINVQNTSDLPQRMSAVPKDFVAGDNGAIENITPNNEQFGMKDWVSADEQNWILKPSETKKITLAVNVPENATVGAHYSIVEIRAFPQIDGQNFQSTIIGGQVGVYLLFNVSGDAQGSGNLKKFDAPIVTGNDVPLKAEFENTGNILYIPHGEIQIQNILTKKLSTIESEKHFVFPNTKYLFEIEWSPGSIFGAYSARAIFVDANGVSHAQQRFFFGKLFFPMLVIFLAVLFFAFRKIIKIMRFKKIVFHDKKHDFDQ